VVRIEVAASPRPCGGDQIISYQVSHRSCLTPFCRISQKASLLLDRYQREPHGILGLFWTDFPRFFAGGGQEGHCEHDGGPGASNL
jgi:hypothetical protein